MLYIHLFKLLQDEVIFLIEKSKNYCYSKLSQNLSDKTTSSKTFFNCFLAAPSSTTMGHYRGSSLTHKPNVNHCILTFSSQRSPGALH